MDTCKACHAADSYKLGRCFECFMRWTKALEVKLSVRPVDPMDFLPCQSMGLEEIDLEAPHV